MFCVVDSRYILIPLSDKGDIHRTAHTYGCAGSLQLSKYNNIIFSTPLPQNIMSSFPLQISVRTWHSDNYHYKLLLDLENSNMLLF